MQHSPQDIKTKLGEAVDPDGNVLNMATLIEVIGLLERTHLTKEALEQTRIGRTVNLLRKKTNNEDIARRAKRLVKRWQKLVQDHMEAVRTTNSPLNGISSNIPLVNGSAKTDEQVISPAVNVDKHHPKGKGTKRKRLSVDGLTPCANNTTSNDKDNTRTSKNDVLPQNNKTLDQNSQDAGHNHSEEQPSSTSHTTMESNLAKRIKTVNNGNCTKDTSQDVIERLGNGVKSPTKIEESPPMTTCDSDDTDVRWEGKDVGVQTDEMVEPGCKTNTSTNLDSLLEVECRANGVNGRFGEDGTWHRWDEAMSCNEGNLVILPYVLLE